MIQTNPLPQLSATKIRTGLSSFEKLVECLIRQYENRPEATRLRHAPNRGLHSQPAAAISPQAMTAATATANKQAAANQNSTHRREKQATFCWYDN